MFTDYFKINFEKFILISRPYSLENLEDYEKHFTVMNYKQNVNLKQVNLFLCL